jgi:hypothetical protein
MLDNEIKKTLLGYIGNDFIPGIPARDLTEEEVEEYGGEEYLVKTGLYKKMDEEKGGRSINKRAASPQQKKTANP